jgi:hypothetical protein
MQRGPDPRDIPLGKLPPQPTSAADARGALTALMRLLGPPSRSRIRLLRVHGPAPTGCMKARHQPDNSVLGDNFSAADRHRAVDQSA